MFALLLPLMIMSDPVPIAGRPVDFSGAVGGPFVVTMAVDRNEIRVQERLNLKVTISGPGDLSQVKTLELTANVDFSKQFAISEGPSRQTVDRNTVEFSYVICAKIDNIEEIPRIRFVYFNPQIKPAPKGWQSTYSEPIKLIVLPLRMPNPIVAPEIQAWIQKAQISKPKTTFQRQLDAWKSLIIGWFGFSRTTMQVTLLMTIFWLAPLALGLVIRYRRFLQKELSTNK